MALWGSKKPEPEGNGKVVDTMYGKPPPAVEPVQPTVPTPMPIAPAFGIDQTISLMRSLPANKDPLLVVAVMKATLESVNVHVSDIIADAIRRMGEVEQRVADLKAENEALEREMDRRAKEIMQLEQAHAEVVKVKDFLSSG